MLESAIAYLTGEDGSTQAAGDIGLIFAKSINGEAPTSLGVVNANQTAGFDMPSHLIGCTKIEGSSSGEGQLAGPRFGNIIHGMYHDQNGGGGQHRVVLQGEPESGSSVGFDTIYVAGFTGGSFDFSTGVLADGAVTDDATTSITTKTVDPRKAFQVGDEVYLMDVDTPIGTIKSMTATNITLNAPIAGGTDIADEDEFMNATPVKIMLGFSR